MLLLGEIILSNMATASRYHSPFSDNSPSFCFLDSRETRRHFSKQVISDAALLLSIPSVLERYSLNVPPLVEENSRIVKTKPTLDADVLTLFFHGRNGQGIIRKIIRTKVTSAG